MVPDFPEVKHFPKIPVGHQLQNGFHFYGRVEADKCFKLSQGGESKVYGLLLWFGGARARGVSTGVIEHFLSLSLDRLPVSLKQSQ
jgi:hypothetical protein